jgi:SAM-dependent methyltransferase
VRQYVGRHTRLLDVGCGRGGLVELLSDQVALAVGLDPHLRSLVRHRLLTLNRVAGQAERLAFPDGYFDLVISSWVLEHLARPQRAFGEVARVLKDPDPQRGQEGGHFVFLTPNALHPLAWIGNLLGRVGRVQDRLVTLLYGRSELDTYPVLYRANTRRGLLTRAAEAGLKPVTLSAIGDPTYLAFNDWLFHLASAIERLTPRWNKIHLVGDFVKGGPHDPP